MNKIIHRFKIVAFTVMFSVLGATSVLASPTAPPVRRVDIDDVTDIQTLIERATGWAFFFFFAVAVLFILLAGLDYMKGDDKSISAAKNKLKYALVGIVIALVARSIPFLIANFLTVS